MQLQRLLSVDLCGRRQWSSGPPSRSRPPPIGRSQSSHDLKTHISVSSPTEKTPTISPLARNEAKRFTFNGTNKKQNFHPRQPRTRTKFTITDGQSEETDQWPGSPQTEVSDSGCVSPSTTRRDNIDGCESDSVQRINSAFSDEDEGLEDPFIETSDYSCNFNSEDMKIQNSANETQTDRTQQDGKAQLQNATESQWFENPEQLNERSLTQAAIESLAPTKDLNVEDLKGDGHNGTHFIEDISKHQGPSVGGLIDGSSSLADEDSNSIDKAAHNKKLEHTNQGFSDLKTVFIARSQGETFPGPLIVTNFDAVFHENGNHVSHDNEKNEMTTIKAEVNRALERKKESEKLSKETFAIDRHAVDIDDDVFAPGTAQSPKDLPAFKRKLHWKKDQTKNDKIERTFFV